MMILDHKSVGWSRFAMQVRFLLVFLIIPVAVCEGARVVTITFEKAPGPDGKLGTADDSALSELTHISDQFESVGVVFSLVQGGTPFIATAGPPRVAFGGPGHLDDDQPTASGSNTLTDGTVEGGYAAFEADIAAQFTRPVSSVSLLLIDYVGDCPLDTVGITASLNAYDAQNRLVASDSYTVTGDEHDGMQLSLQVTAPGIMQVELSGTTEDCGTAIDDFAFTVEAVPPVAAFEYSPSNPAVNEVVSFDASASEDPDGGALTYEWDFGDGGTGSGAQETHTYSQMGDYTVMLKVVDSDGLDATVSKTITVEGLPPVASFTYEPPAPRLTDKVVFDASASYDPDPDGQIVDYQWDFGDGGSTSSSWSGATHTYDRPDRYEVTLTVTDDEGRTSSTTQTIHVSDELMLDVWTEGHFVSPYGMSRSASVTIHVKVLNVEGMPVHGAEIQIDGKSVGSTNSNGRLDPPPLPIPDSPPIVGTATVLATWNDLSATSKVELYRLVELLGRSAIVSPSQAASQNRYRFVGDMDAMPATGESDAGSALQNALDAAEICYEYIAYPDDKVTERHFLCSATDVVPAYLVRVKVERKGRIIFQTGAWAEDEDAVSWIKLVPHFGDNQPPIFLGWMQSPTTFLVTAPDGSCVGYDPSTGQAVYDFPVGVTAEGNEPNSLFILNPTPGAYFVDVAPKPTARLDDTYSFEVMINGEHVVLADHTRIGDIPAQPYVVVVPGSLDVLAPGDVSGNEIVTDYDAAVTAAYAVGTADLQPTQAAAADVSASGTVSAYDAALIASVAAGLIDPLPVEEQNLVAYVDAQALDVATGEVVTLTVGPTSASDQDSRVEVPVLVSEATGLGIISLDLEVQYDQSQLSFSTISVDDTIIPDWDYEVNERTDGTIAVALYGTHPVEGHGSLLSLAFDIRDEAASGSSRVYCERAELNEGAVLSVTQAGDITIDRGVVPEPLAYWTFDEGAGNIALDASGNGHDGVIWGNPRWVAGIVGGALDFDGYGDYVDCGNPVGLNIQDKITLACWIKVASFSRNWETILAKGDDSYRLSRSSGTGAGNGNAVHFGITGTTTYFFDGTATVTDDQWHHVAGVYDGSQAAIYVDGVLDRAVPATGRISSTTYPLYIGENSEQRGRYLNGIVDDVRIYNRALNAQEVQQCMLGGAAMVIGNFEQSMEGWGPTEETPGPTLNYSTTGATLGQRSLAVRPNKNGFQWSFMCTGLWDFRIYKRLSADVTWVAAEWGATPWSNFKEIAVNSDGPSGWKQYIPNDTVSPDWPGSWDPVSWGNHTRTLVWDLSDYDATGATWMQVIFSTNFSGSTPGKYYIDNVRLISE